MAVRFLLNGVPRAEDAASPTMTLLDWLRTVARLTGTKEGCAEGDCGACTIAVARPRDGGFRYEAVNSCLMVLPRSTAARFSPSRASPTATGCHPAQQALLD